MRSSIACEKCRKSKTKCINNGIKSVCKACETAGRECRYTDSAISNGGGSQRRESTAADGENPPRKRRKNLAPTGSTALRPKEGGLGTYEDALDSPLLTPQVWEELFDIYEKHFAIDFPFLHKRTFLNSIQQGPPGASHTKPELTPHPYYPPLLLAFLTQTARHHEKLAGHSNSKCSIETADFYAEATRVHMGYNFPGKPTLEKIQALLMLGYHEYTSLQGTQGWVKIGTAIRCAQNMGYQWDADYDDPIDPEDHKREDKLAKLRGKRQEQPPENPISEKDHFILREIQRRTLWSCVILDRYMSWGKNRPQMLRTEELKRIQLICSDSAFMFGRKVRTRFLGENDAEYWKRRTKLNESNKLRREEIRLTDLADKLKSQYEDIKWEAGDAESDLVWYIQIVDYFGEVSKWSSHGGRQLEGRRPPWDERTTFYKLERDLNKLKAGLPDHLQLTPENTQDRIYHGSDRYLLIHTMYTMCTVWLYREYMAMAPWAIPYPKGPLDEPLITESPPYPEYWVRQAKVCFGACRDYADLVHAIHSSRSHNKLAETPTVAFAAYTVAWSAIYCWYFPRMDPDSVLSREPRAYDITRDFLGSMSQRFKMANEWMYYLSEVHAYYKEERRKYKSVGGVVGDSPQSSTSNEGSGLKDYARLFETSHKSFGVLRDRDESEWDNDIRAAHSRLDHADALDERSDSTNAPTLKAEGKGSTTGMAAEDVSVSSAFTAVNHTTPKTAHVKLDPLSHSRAISHDQVPVYRTQNSNNAQHMDIAFNPHDRSYGSPTGHYHQNVVPYSSVGGSGAQGSQRTDSGMDEDAKFRNWPPVGVAADEAKAQIEQDGTQSLSNNRLVGGMVMGDPFSFDNTFGYSMTPYPGYTPIYNTTHPMQDSGWYSTGYGPNNYPYHPS